MKKSMSNPVEFACGVKSRNRFMLAPMTNLQSHDDGTLSDDEYNWLTMRAKGGFGITTTCASQVQEIGKGFPGQLGIFSDDHLEGLRRLSAGIKAHGSVALVQLYHGGMRSPQDVIGAQPVCPSDNEKHGARGMTLAEVHELRDDFVAAAIRAKESGHDGVEVHGAHGYILTQFLSSEINKRDDEYGGSLENRSRLLFEIVDSIRTECGQGFMLAVRISPERFGMKLDEVKTIAQQLMDEGKVDLLDMSLWDVFKQPEEEEYQDRSLLEHFTTLERGKTKLTVAGKIRTGADVEKVLEADVDLACVGRSAILHHDLPYRLMDDPDFVPTRPPVTPEYLSSEGLGDAFIQYMRNWGGFVDSKI